MYQIWHSWRGGLARKLAQKSTLAPATCLRVVGALPRDGDQHLGVAAAQVARILSGCQWFIDIRMVGHVNVPIQVLSACYCSAHTTSHRRQLLIASQPARLPRRSNARGLSKQLTGQPINGAPSPPHVPKAQRRDLASAKRDTSIGSSATNAQRGSARCW
jgi:hypothetical protein